MIFLILVLIISFFLRFPSLFEPVWYGDEGIYQVIGQALREGRQLYSGIWDNKPPLLYLLYAMLDGDQFWVRLLSLIFLLFSIVVFYFLSKKLFTQRRPVVISTALFAFLFSTPVLEGNIANAENFMMLPILTAALFVFKKREMWSGLLLSLAFLTKIVAIFDLAAILTFLYLSNPKISMRNIRQLVVGFVIPIVITVLFFKLNGNYDNFIRATFSQNVDYVGVNTPLLIKTTLLTLFISVIFLKRQLLSKTQLFIFLWLGFSLYNAFFGQRPWTHYLLVVLPSFSLLAGLLFADKAFKDKKALALTLVTLALIPGNFWIYGKFLAYYPNFTSFLSGQKIVSQYQEFFAPHVERDYRLSQFLRGKTLPNEKIFIWGDNAQIYVLADKLPPGRYTVAYHVIFYEDAVNETRKILSEQRPRYIVVIKEISPHEEFLRGYKLAYEISGAYIYERNSRLLEK